MKLDVAIFEVPRLRCLNDVKLPTPFKFPLFNVMVQTAVNTRKIEKDEILYFTTMLDDESEGEGKYVVRSVDITLEHLVGYVVWTYTYVHA